MTKISQKPSIGLVPSQSSYATAHDDSVHHLAFDYAAQANIISSVKSGKILLANTACCELLGYTMTQLLKKRKADIFDINDAGFKQLMRKRTAAGGSTGEGTAYKRNGDSFKCLISSAIFLDEDGIQKSITTIIDQSDQILKQTNIDTIKENIVANDILIAIAKQNKIDSKQKLIAERNIIVAEKRHLQKEQKQASIAAKNIAREMKNSALVLARNNEWIRNIAKTSYDVMWDWDLATGEMYVGDSIEEVFGYKVQDNTIRFSDCLNLIVPGERDAVERKIKKTIAAGQKQWNDSFKIKRFDGSIATITTRASILWNDKGNVSHFIGSIQDVSKLWEMEQQLEKQVMLAQQQIESFQLLSRLSFDGIWDFNIVTNHFFLSESFAVAFGISIKDKISLENVWTQIAHPDDRLDAEQSIQKALLSTETHWEHTGRLIHPKGIVAQVFCRANIMRDKAGKALRIIGAVHDLSKENKLEERLKQEISLKELQIIDAMADARDAERSIIGQELHDNINQLLGASRLYLDLAKKGGDESESHLSRSSEYTLTAIDEIRKLSKGLTTDAIKHIGLKDAVRNIARDTMETSAIQIKFSCRSFIENASGTKFHLNIFRIVQEQLNNIIKHAKATKISILLGQSSRHVTLQIADNGVGFDTFTNRTGIGFQNIMSRATNYGGTIELDSHPGKGCSLKIRFPLEAGGTQ